VESVAALKVDDEAAGNADVPAAAALAINVQAAKAVQRTMRGRNIRAL